MKLLARATFLAALALPAIAPAEPTGAGGQAPPNAEVLLLEVIENWLVERFDLQPGSEPPGLAFADPERLTAMRYGSAAAGTAADVLGVYNDDETTIYLRAGSDVGVAAYVSVIVHEMVHHLQGSAGQRFACPAEREVTAYDAQDAWLRLFGLSLASEFGIDEGTRKLRTMCAY